MTVDSPKPQCAMRDFRFPLRSDWELCSSELLHSE